MGIETEANRRNSTHTAVHRAGKVSKGAKPEAADLEQSFRSAPEAAVHVITR
jgi:hypothetical protein